MPFDVEAIRSQFPILGRTFGDTPLIYLDSAASAQKPEAVIAAMSHAMRHSYANVHRGLHRLANEVTDAYEAARQTVAEFIGASDSEIVFTKSATEAINLVAHSYGTRLKPGDEILITEMEHHANIVPWHMLAQRTGAVLTWVPITDDGVLDMVAFRALLSPKTRLVAVTHMSNVLGTINPLAEIIQAAHEVGAVVLVDGCQAIVHESVDVRALGCDFYAFSGHKLYGPTGIGVLYGRAEILADMPPFLGGGEMINRVSKTSITYNEPPFRFEAGTPAILEAIGLKAAVDWVRALDRNVVHAHEMALYDCAKRGLSKIEGVSLVAPDTHKGAILTFRVGHAHAHDIAQILDRYGIAVRAGTHCAEPLMEKLGGQATVRASFAVYNRMEEAEALIKAVSKAKSFFEAA